MRSTQKTGAHSETGDQFGRISPKEEDHRTNTEPLPDHYQCFNTSIKVYQFFGFFTEQTPKSLFSKLHQMITWTSWYWFTGSLAINFILLVVNYIRNPSGNRGTEMFQRAFEAFLAPMFLFEMRYFIHNYYQLVSEMRTKFHRDAENMRQCAKEERTIVIFSFILVTANMVIAYYRKLFFGLPPQEVELVAYYYHKSRPERQLPFIMWFPFDDTLNPMYYFAAGLNWYLMILTLILAYHINSCTLIFAVHVRGQYRLLAQHLRNVTTHCACVDNTQCGCVYIERERLRRSLRYHQYLMDFRNRLQDSLKVMTLLKMCAYDLVLTVSLYQLSFISQLNIASFQLVFQFICIYSFSFVVTQSSEMLEQGNIALRWAAYDNPWTNGLFLVNQSTGPYTPQPSAQPTNTAFTPTEWTENSTTHARSNASKQRIHPDNEKKPTAHAYNFTWTETNASNNAFATAWTDHSDATDHAHAFTNGQTPTAHAFTKYQHPSAHAHKSSARASYHILWLVMLMQQCERPIRLIYYGGVIDICYRAFIVVLRFSYSVFALLKRSINVK